MACESFALQEGLLVVLFAVASLIGIKEKLTSAGTWRYVVAKPVPILLLLLHLASVLLAGSSSSTSLHENLRLVLLGAFFGMLGDIGLSLGMLGRMYPLLGVFSFAVGHYFYVAAFLHGTGAAKVRSSPL